MVQLKISQHLFDSVEELKSKSESLFLENANHLYDDGKYLLLINSDGRYAITAIKLNDSEWTFAFRHMEFGYTKDNGQINAHLLQTHQIFAIHALEIPSLLNTREDVVELIKKINDMFGHSFSEAINKLQ